MTIVELFAREMHNAYRAGQKALECPTGKITGKFRHDHGWIACHRQPYFRARARRLLKQLGLMGIILRLASTKEKK